ncbi:MAG TPA: FAD-dependent oxidoreductase [Anaerolineaceae bacterium]|nr:FAD-dependent oxidoreductase [Anaerolineaceae bacterium]
MNIKEDSQVFDTLIIGGGPAGATAGIYAARAGLKVAILDRGLTSGALAITRKIDNYPGIEGEISGADLLQNMRRQAQQFGVLCIDDKAIGTDLKSEPKLVFGNLNTYQAKTIIIATGSMGRSNLLKGEAELLGKGVSYCAICDGAFFKDKTVFVAGSSDEAVDEALYLANIVSQVYLLCPTPELRASKTLIKDLESRQNLTLVLGAALKEIYGDGKVEGVKYIVRGEGVKDLQTSGAFLYLQGGVPITDYLAGQLDLSPEGCILVDREYQTAIPGVFAVGDVLCSHIKQAVIAAADGAIAGIAAQKYITGRKQMGFDWSK